MSYEPCTTWSRRKRHLSDALTTKTAGGRRGVTLCGADGQDEAETNHWLTRFSAKTIEIALLPDCKKCVKRAEVLARTEVVGEAGSEAPPKDRQGES